MVQANLHGRAQPKIKTIDVETNLLSERISERERLLDALTRRAIIGILVLCFAIIALPTAYRVQAKTTERAAAASIAATKAEKLLADKRAILTSAQPVVQETEMLSTVRTYSGNLLGQVGRFLNSSTDKMVFSNIRIDVLGGDLKLTGRADAESYAVARDFVARLAKLPNAKQVTLKKWRQNSDFGAAGVTFEVEYSAGVGK